MADGNNAFHPDPSNATFIFDDGPITLSDGRSMRAATPQSALSEEIAIIDTVAYGDINQDNKEDTVLLLTRYGGGSGTFIYAAAFVSGPVSYKGSRVLFIGDRVAPQSISINRGIITVEYLDRNPSEAFAAEPTVLTSKQFIYSNSTNLQER